MISLREVHPEKAQFPIDLTQGGNDKLSNDEQFSKVESPIDETLWGISIFFKLLQFLKEEALIFVIGEEMATSFKEVQS